MKKANDQLEDIQKQLKLLTEALKGRKDDLGVTSPYDRGLVADVKDLTNKLEDLSKQLDALKNKTSQSFRPNTTAPAAPVVDAMAGKATVRIVNEYQVEISMVVNGTSYKIAPSKSYDVTVPAGDFTYQLLQTGSAPTRSQIKEKEFVTLRIK
jgi:seryl-tRNA synthetase